MIKPALSFAIILALILTLAACAPGQDARDASLAIGPGFNLLVVAEGEVELKREGWSGFHRTAFGATLHRGDQLRLASEATAIVLCDDLTTWRVPSGVSSGLTNGCPQPQEPTLMRGDSAIGNTRGGSDPLIPYIVSPRSTLLLNPQPTLRWNAVPGATRYNVSLRGGDVSWAIEVSETEVVYPGEPPLKLGVTYLLIVDADSGASSQDEGVAGLGFTLLNETEAERVRAAAEQLQDRELPDQAESFALAQLYAGYSLNAEAIETLETLSDESSQAAAVNRMLGDLYRQSGLNLLAEARYLTAIEQAASAGDVEGQTIAQAGLGEVYAALGKLDDAIARLTEAQTAYEMLGDSQRASEVGARLAELTP